MAEIVLIAAMDRARAIGVGNRLPWHLPDDLKRFKALTLGKPILMGRKTAESLGRALPGRRNLVLTRSGRAPFDGMEAFGDLGTALSAGARDGEAVCVIGGGELYGLTLRIATSLRLTHVDTAVADADTFFPALDRAIWRKTASKPHTADARHAFAFEFADYVRV